jgi:hypothetical protein
LIRIDLSQEIEPGRYAYAKDLSSQVQQVIVALLLSLVTQAVQRLLLLHQVFTLNIRTDKVATGFLDTGYIRYATIEKNTLS